MRGFDLTPLFRSSIGFDRMRDLMEATQRMSDAPAYPPYNIEKLGENAYRITMAVAGFGESDLTITAQDNSLVIAGKVEREEGVDEPKFLHRGIAGRAFERRFELAEHIRVNGASLENGLLHVDLVREVPEAMKPRQIKIAADTGAGKQRVIDQKAA
ncbi:MAG: Hsp20 family protein [Dongiaceae bacterium]